MAMARHGAVALHYKVNGKGPALLFLRGFKATWALWEATISSLSDSYRCIAMDLRGHGSSQNRKRHTYTLDELAQDALQVLNDAAVDQTVVVGHSMGGMVAQHLAVHYQDRMSALVLSSTTCFAPNREIFFPMIEDAINPGRIYPKDRQANQALRHSVPLDSDTAWGCGESIMSLPRYDLELQDFPLSALVMYGDQDNNNIIGGSKSLVASLPDCRESIIVGAGHVPQVTHAEAYSQALADFLRDTLRED